MSDWDRKEGQERREAFPCRLPGGPETDPLPDSLAQLARKLDAALQRRGKSDAGGATGADGGERPGD